MILCRRANADSVLDSDTDTVTVVRPQAVALVMPVSAVDISRRRRALRAPEVAGEPDADLGRRSRVGCHGCHATSTASARYSGRWWWLRWGWRLGLIQVGGRKSGRPSAAS